MFSPNVRRRRPHARRAGQSRDESTVLGLITRRIAQIVPGARKLASAALWRGLGDDPRLRHAGRERPHPQRAGERRCYGAASF